MNILLTPMSNLTTSYGAMTRCIAVARKAKEMGHNPIIAAGKDDVNQELMKKLEITVIESPVPIPFGLPRFAGKVLAKIISAIDIPYSKPEDAPMQSFDVPLFMMGGTKEKFFRQDIKEIRRIIETYHIDAVYSEFRLSGIVAAKLAKVKCITSYGKPESSEWGYSEKAARDVNRVLSELGLPGVRSTLDIFHWADYKIVPSIEEFESFTDTSNVVYVGPLVHEEATHPKPTKRFILVYMGVAVFASRKVERVCSEAFRGLPYEVLIGARELREKHVENIKTRKFVRFEDYFPEAVLFINHAGQNSSMSGLINGVPQINFPGFIYERRFNAKNVEKVGAGIFCEREDFTPDRLRALVRQIENDSKYAANAANIGKKLLAQGGAEKVIKLMMK